MRGEGWKDTGRGINDEGTSTTDNYMSSNSKCSKTSMLSSKCTSNIYEQKIFQLCISTVQRLAAKLINKQAMQF